MPPAIVDVHSHFMPPAVAQKTAFFKAGWSDIDRHLSLMDDCGIAQSVLLYPTSDAHIQMNGWRNVCAEYNPAIANIVKAHKDRFFGAGILPFDEPKLFAQELKRIQDFDFTVISLASSYEGIYLDDDRFHQIFEFAGKNNMVIHVHSQILNPIGEERVRDPLLSPVLEYVFDVSMCLGKMMMSGTFLAYPNVKFIFAHYGGVLPLVKERFDNTYQMLRSRGFVKDLGKLPSEYFKNLYFDTSGSKSLASLNAALEITDVGHILYGSDFPANQSVAASIDVVQKAGSDNRAMARILSENSRALFSRKARQPIAEF
ncbi:MAG: hypothetical protein A3C36_00010 [Omnitrophica WOR_2 bacterium RIFCSPHIGHO2_02_FULL_52_10]|nr:MAG: hypothetical protein A3C36_00010 [Omnitrophica WOR_2 bacterium RIFCSPHIGHO2_02_FULL_52_10]